jgi:N-acyl-D-amino-acid deacylase
MAVRQNDGSRQTGKKLIGKFGATWDVPDGEGGRTYRYTRVSAPMRLTLVNGVTTFGRGAFTGKFPGQYIGPVQPQPATTIE